MKFHSIFTKTSRGYRLPVIIFLVHLVLFLSGCGETQPGTPTISPTPKPAETTAPPATPTAPPTDFPTPHPPLGLLIAPEGSPGWLVSEIAAMLQSLSLESDLQWEVRASLAPGELSPEFQMVVALYGTPNLNELVSAAPDIPFLAIGIPGLDPAPNLSEIDGDGFRPDQQAFLAGYLAAIITEDWRVGVISERGTGQGLAARQGFINGARYFCGLCRPVFPPYENYPLFVEIPSETSPADWQAAADLLLASAVETVYLPPDLDRRELRDYLTDNGVRLIGGAPRGDYPAALWAASVRVAPEIALFDIWPAFATGESTGQETLPLVVTDVNESHLSPGRQKLVEALIPELLEGIVDPGVDPITGEPR